MLILSSRPKLPHDQWRQRVFDKTSRTTRNGRQPNESVSLNADALCHDYTRCVLLCKSTFKSYLSSSINRYPARKQTLEFPHLCAIVSPRRTIDSTMISWVVFTRIYGEAWLSDCTCHTWVLQNARVSVNFEQFFIYASKFHLTWLCAPTDISPCYIYEVRERKCVVIILRTYRNSREIDVWKKMGQISCV